MFSRKRKKTEKTVWLKCKDGKIIEETAKWTPYGWFVPYHNIILKDDGTVESTNYASLISGWKSFE